MNHSSNMFMTPSDLNIANESTDEFNKPVEYLMRFDDFKSNFARRLSNRYLSRSSSVADKKELPVKTFVVEETPENIIKKVQENPQQGQQAVSQTTDVTKPAEHVASKFEQLKSTEVSALNMEVETLKWQLAHTEANRQMHLALLKQIVSFLNRIKDHMETQQECPPPVLPHSLNIADLPRSKSVLHVNKYTDYNLSPTKSNNRKISKSISNVNGFKNYHGMWNQSKLSLTPEDDTGHKLKEEISSLITLATTVLGTKMPDLTYFTNTSNADDTTPKKNLGNDVSTNTNDDIEDSFLKPRSNPKNTSMGDLLEDRVSLTGSSNFGIQNEDTTSNIPSVKGQHTNNNILQGYNKSSNFIEDESGFSSLNSFQEIGIPIINITPPTPSKEALYLDMDLDILDQNGTWKAGVIDIDKQTVKVFWV